MTHPTHIVAVAALILNPEGKVLMIESPDRGWEVPGGQVERGEDLIRALHREILEETGVTVTIGPLVGIYSKIQPPYLVLFTFKGKWVSGTLKTSPESLSVDWVQSQDILERISHPAIHDRVHDLLESNGRIVYRTYLTNPYRIVNQHFL